MLAVALLIAVATVVKLTLIPPSPQERFHTLREKLQALRASADSCRDSLEQEEARFLAYNQRLDSLRGRIDSLESLDPRGVPVDSYRIYLEAFDRYNQGVPGWETAVDSLQAHWRACRILVREHNRLADSARDLAAELDLLPDP